MLPLPRDKSVPSFTNDRITGILDTPFCSCMIVVFSELNAQGVMLRGGERPRCGRCVYVGGDGRDGGEKGIP